MIDDYNTFKIRLKISFEGDITEVKKSFKYKFYIKKVKEKYTKKLQVKKRFLTFFSN